MYEIKSSSRHEKNNKLRWLATDINLNCYALGVLSLMLFLLFFSIFYKDINLGAFDLTKISLLLNAWNGTYNT